MDSSSQSQDYEGYFMPLYLTFMPWSGQCYNESSQQLTSPIRWSSPEFIYAMSTSWTWLDLVSSINCDSAELLRPICTRVDKVINMSADVINHDL